MKENPIGWIEQQIPSETSTIIFKITDFFAGLTPRLFKSLIGSMIAVAFQITFRAEIHVNDFFYFLKIIFNISTSKRSKKYKPHSILTKKKFKI